MSYLLIRQGTSFSYIKNSLCLRIRKNMLIANISSLKTYQMETLAYHANISCTSHTVMLPSNQRRILYDTAISVFQSDKREVCRLNEKGSNAYESFLDIVNRIGMIIGGILLCVMSLAVFASVLSRYIPNFSLTWVEEMVTYGMAWLCTIGGGLATRKGEMTSVTLFLNKVPEKPRRVLRIVNCMASLIVFLFLIRCGYQMALTGALRKAVSFPQVTMFWLYIALPVGVAIMFLNTLGTILRILAEGKEAAS